MKKLFFTMLCLGIFTFSQAQIQKNDKFLYSGIGFYQQSSPILRSNKYIEIPMGVRYGHAFGKHFLGEFEFSGNRFGYNDSDYSYFSRTTNANVYYMLGKKRLQPYFIVGAESDVTTGKNNPLFDGRRSTSIKGGVGAFYFFKPQLALNTKLQYSSELSSLRSLMPNTFVGLEVELLNFLKAGKLFTKETDSERFLEKGKTSLSGKFTYQYGLTKLQTVNSGLLALNIDYERMLNKHFSIGFKSNTYANSAYGYSFSRVNLGYYGRISKSLYTGTSLGASYSYRDYSLESRTFAIVPTANLLYFINQNTAINLGIEHSGYQFTKLRKAGGTYSNIGANIGLKYFLK